MPQRVEFNGEIVEFPDGVSDDQILSFLKAQNSAPPAAPTVDPSQVNRVNALVNSAAQGLTFGTSDEIEAGLSTGLGFLGDYGKELESVRARQDALRQEYPTTSLVGEIGGAVGTGVGAARAGLSLLGGARSVPGAIGRGAVEGAAYGGLYGAGNSEGGAIERAEGFGSGAVQGAAVGGALSGASQGVVNSLARRAAKKAAPSLDDLAGVKDRAYQAVDQSGFKFPQSQWDQFVGDLQNVMSQDKISAARNPKAASMLGDIADMKGMTPSLSEVDKLRQVISRDVAGATDPSERRFGQMMIDKIDTLVDQASGAPALKTALDATRRIKKSEQITEALMKGERRAQSTGSGGNVENAMRQNVRGILDNASKRRGFTPEEISAMEDFVRGGKVQNLMRLVGKLSPGGSGLMTALGIGGTMANPLLGVPALAGMGAKAIADKSVRGKAEVLDALIRSGRNIGGGQQLPASTRAVVDALAARSGATPIAEQRPLELTVRPRR